MFDGKLTPVSPDFASRYIICESCVDKLNLFVGTAVAHSVEDVDQLL